MSISLTVDIIMYSLQTQSVLFIKRKNEPFKDYFALPGGFVDETDKDLKAAAIRELKEETNIDFNNLKQLYTVGNQERDPRGYTVSVVYYGLIDNILEAEAGSTFSDLPP